MEISERELAQFLEATEKQELATWQRQRTATELGTFVARRLAALDERIDELLLVDANTD